MVYNIHIKIDGEFDVYCVVFEFKDAEVVNREYSRAQVISGPGNPIIEVVVDCCLVDAKSGRCYSMPELIETYRDVLIRESRKQGLLRWLIP